MVPRYERPDQSPVVKLLCCLGCGVRLVRGKRALQRWTVLGRQRRHVRELRVRDEARLDAAWLHTRGVHTERPEHRCLRLRESFNRELGGAIHIVERLAPDAAHQADVDDLARALLTQGSQDGLLASNHTEHVRVELCLYRIHAELLNRAKDGLPCVVDENVHTPRLLQDCFERLRDTFIGIDVKLDGLNEGSIDIRFGDCSIKRRTFL